MDIKEFILKKKDLFLVVGIFLAVIAVIVVAYLLVSGNDNNGDKEKDKTPTELVTVKYDKDSSVLTAKDMSPNDTIKKPFEVIVTPINGVKTGTYTLQLVLSNNTYEYCDDDNYNAKTNACIKNEKELIYSLKDKDGKELASGNLTGVIGEVDILTETKKVEKSTGFDYTLEIKYKSTGKAQNHNKNKTVTGDIKVIFAE